VSDGDYSALNWAAAGALVFSLGLFLMLASIKAARPSATGE
jgi:hypothetical protein